VKGCRHAVAGGFNENNAMAYPTPTPEPSSHLIDEDTIMDDDGEIFDSDPTLVDMQTDETFFEEDETLVELDISMGEEGDESRGASDGDHEYDDGSDSQDGDALKAGWSEETIQTEAMVRLGLCINTAARVVICLACASAVKPRELPTHFARVHRPMSTTTSISEELITTYDLRPDVNLRPGSLITAVYGLDLVTGYLACDTCGYACKTVPAMKRHTKESEGCKDFRKRPVQTFVPNSKQWYFGVNLKPEPTDEVAELSLDPLPYLLKKFAPVPFSSIPIKSAKTPADANHFLNIEKWDLYVEGKTGAEITELLREREPNLRAEVRICVERFADQVVTKLTNVYHEPMAAMGDYTG